MKKKYAIVLLVLSISILAIIFQNFTSKSTFENQDFDYVINVSDNEFGAIPNDSIDDTLSIIKASEKAKKIVIANPKARVAVLFPVGNYLISPLVEKINSNGEKKFIKNMIPFYNGISYVGLTAINSSGKARFIHHPSPCLKYQETDPTIFKNCHAHNKAARMVYGMRIENKFVNDDGFVSMSNTGSSFLTVGSIVS